MQIMHEYLSAAPFDLDDLHIFHLLAETAHFTHAARRAGLTQSSLTRRVQSMEQKLGVPLFERSTRRVSRRGDRLARTRRFAGASLRSGVCC